MKAFEKKRKFSLCLLILTFCLITYIIWVVPHSGFVDVFRENSDLTTFVVDPGHGGIDGGASGASGVTEKDINLSIAKRVDCLLVFWGCYSCLTRNDSESLGYDPDASIRENKIVDMHKRVEFISSCQNPVLLSIHLNKFSNSRYKGAQVFYSGNHPKSRTLAQALQKTMIDGLDKENTRKAKQAGNEVYLMKQITSPAVIVECGFLSNPEDETNLQNDNYQKRIALAVLSGVQQYKNS